MAKNSITPLPQPVVVTTICSLCDEPWEAHGDRPTSADCIRLLKAKLATRPTPYVVPYVQPYVYPVQPYRPYWGTTMTVSSSVGATGGGGGGGASYGAINAGGGGGAIVRFVRPDDDDGCAPVPVAV